MGWILAAALFAAAFWLPEAAAPSRQGRLLTVAAALGAVNLLLHRLLPRSSDGRLRYRSEDRTLTISAVMVLLLTLYLYELPGSASELSYLYALPMFGAASVLQARAVLAASSLSLVAMIGLHAAGSAVGTFWSAEFVVRLAVFAVVSGGLVAVTHGLRRRRDEAERLSEDLSYRLDLVQAIGSLARQAELTPRLDELAARLGEIIADAVRSEGHAIFVAEGERGERLRLIGAAAGDMRGLEALNDEENGGFLKGVFETGTARVLDGGSVRTLCGAVGIRNMLVLPLRARTAAIGVLCLLNRRDAGTFGQEDIRSSEQLAGCAAGLLQGALLFRRGLEERQTVGRMAKLLVGREVKMRELKDRLRAMKEL